MVLGKEVLTTLEELILPKHTALMVVDVQNDFCGPGGYYDKLESSNMGMIKSCIDHLEGLLVRARQVKAMIIYTQATNRRNGIFKSAPDLAKKTETRDPDSPLICVECEWGHQIVDRLKPLPNEIVIRKHRHNSFMGTELDLLLRSNGVKTLIIAGVVTEQCVLATICGAIAHDYYVVVPKDCVASPNLEMHNAALLVISGNISTEGLTDSSRIISAWSG
jgi:nicotinamidase-related amidase